MSLVCASHAEFLKNKASVTAHDGRFKVLIVPIITDEHSVEITDYYIYYFLYFISIR